MNVLALVVAFVGGVVLTNSPLAAIQFLWVNMIMDTLAALALATESPKPELLERPPYRKFEYIISQKMMKHILGQTFVQMGFLFAFVFGAQSFLPEFAPPLGAIAGKPVTDLNTNVFYDYWNAVGIKYDELKKHENPKYRDWDGRFVLSGMNTDFDGKLAYKPLLKESKSRHLTAVFNLFVWFQIFNMICCRKINDELNVFAHIFENFYFGVVWLAICGL